jgi:alkylation response protein AidB-like acyl-CoA dehydrogenase
MNFAEPAGCAEVRAAARAFVDEFVTVDVLERERATGNGVDPLLHKLMGERGWIASQWPRDEGGCGFDAHQAATLRLELGRAGVPLIGQFTTMIPANAIRAFGAPSLKRDVLPGIAQGDRLICLGYTEPESGSDVASARTRATRDGDDWVITGQKVFTTYAHMADDCFLLTRTNPEAPKHRGLTMFLVPLDSEGIDIRPVHTVGGERTNIVYYDNVVVPDARRIGDVDGGWGVLRYALTLEHVGGLSPEAARLWDRALAWAQQPAADGSRPIDRVDVRRTMARIAARNEVARLLGNRVSYLMATGKSVGPAGPMANLYGPESYLQGANELIDLVGPSGLLEGEDGLGGGEILHLFRASVGATIYGGTSEVMRGLIAETALGLPRAGRH